MTLDVTKPMQYRSGKYAGAIRYVGELKPDQQIFAVQSDCDFEHIEKRFANGRVSHYGGLYPGDIINVPNLPPERVDRYVVKLPFQERGFFVSLWYLDSDRTMRRVEGRLMNLGGSPRTQGDDGAGGHT